MKAENLLNKRVYPISIPTPFAVGEVYSYLINDEKKVLVDCGHMSDESWALLIRRLREQNIEIEDIDEIWLTHGHPDHFGQAARVAEQSGAVVRGHPKERSNFACNDDRELFRAFFERYGIPSGQIGHMVEQLDWLQQYQEPVEPEWITEQSELSTGRLAFRVRHTPGHAPGHVCYYSDNGIVFGGDVLLKDTSTNALINFDPDTGKRNRSLLQYRQTLSWMKELEGLVLPGHGEFIHSPAGVAGHHLDNQEVRYRRILKLLGQKARSLPELALRLFPDAVRGGDIFLVLSEVMGYLDWGMEEEKVQMEDGVFARKGA